MVSREPDQPNIASVSDLDDSSIHTPTMTAENVTLDLEKDHASPSWVPFTWIYRHHSLYLMRQRAHIA
jgi:hypothetical protein